MGHQSIRTLATDCGSVVAVNCHRKRGSNCLIYS